MSRAHRSLWILIAVTILAVGVLAQALAGPSSTTADLIVAASGFVVAVSGTLLVRVLRYLTRTPTADTWPRMHTRR